MNTTRIALALLAMAAIPATVNGDEPGTDLNGTWYQHIRTTSVAKLPVIGKVENESNFYAVVQVEQVNGSLSMTTEPCFVRMEGEMKRVKTIVPSAMTKVMGPKKRSGTVNGRTVEFGRAIDVLGAKLQNEWKDPLPEEPDDPTVLDEDGDGNPGVTVQISGPVDGQIFVVQRAWNSLKGEASADGNAVQGNVTWRSSQNVLDSTSMFLKANPESNPHKDPKKNTFNMLRAPDGATCAELSKRYVKLFKKG